MPPDTTIGPLMQGGNQITRSRDHKGGAPRWRQ